MRAAIFALLVLTALPAGAAQLAPRAEWAQGIADQNKAYAATPHAMLKIQDSVYLGEGDAATLSGRKGDPGSWKWHAGPGAKAALSLALKHGVLTVTRGGEKLEARALTKSIAVDKDVDIAGQPTQVQAGVNGWRIFVYNQQNPQAKAFKGVSYFPYDPAFRVTAAFVPDAKLPPRVFRTSRGTGKQFFHAGDAVFTLKGKDVRLPFYTDSHDAKTITGLSAFFHDDLTNNGAYGAGRYVDAEPFGAFAPRRLVIDFNEAYNPNCARSAHFTCPLAVDALPLAVTAGERDPHQAH